MLPVITVSLILALVSWPGNLNADLCTKSAALKLIKITKVYVDKRKDITLDTEALEGSMEEAKALAKKVGTQLRAIQDYGTDKEIPEGATSFLFQESVVVIKNGHSQNQGHVCSTISQKFHFRPFFPTGENLVDFLLEAKQNVVTTLILELFPHGLGVYNKEHDLVVGLSTEDLYQTGSQANANFDEDSLSPVLEFDALVPTKTSVENRGLIKFKKVNSISHEGNIACSRPMRVMEEINGLSEQMSAMRAGFQAASANFTNAYDNVAALKNSGAAKTEISPAFPTIRTGALEGFLSFAKYATEIIAKKGVFNKPSSSFYHIIPLMSSQLSKWSKKYVNLENGVKLARKIKSGLSPKKVLGKRFQAKAHTNSDDDYLVQGKLTYSEPTGVEKIYEILPLQSPNGLIAHKYLVMRGQGSYVTNQRPFYTECKDLNGQVCMKPRVALSKSDLQCAKQILENIESPTSCPYTLASKDALRTVECSSFNVIAYFAEPTLITLMDLHGEYNLTIQGVTKMKVNANIESPMGSAFLGEEAVDIKKFKQMISDLNPPHLIESLWTKLLESNYLYLAVGLLALLIIMCAGFSTCSVMYIKGWTCRALCYKMSCKSSSSDQELTTFSSGPSPAEASKAKFIRHPTKKTSHKRYTEEPSIYMINRAAGMIAEKTAKILTDVEASVGKKEHPGTTNQQAGFPAGSLAPHAPTAEQGELDALLTISSHQTTVPEQHPIRIFPKQ